MKQDSESLTNKTDVMGTVSVLHVWPHTIIMQLSHEPLSLDVVCPIYSAKLLLCIITLSMKTFTIYYYSLYAFDIADLITEEKWPKTANVFPFDTMIYG